MKRHPHHWFITGTDTEVGKTMVTACMAAAAAVRGTVVAAKPLATGVSGDDPGRDAAILAKAAGHPAKEWATAAAPLSPHRAFQEGEIDEDALRSWIESLNADTVLIEGVGGWRVPLLGGARPLEVKDLALWSRGGVVMVAPDQLGVINHARLTKEAIEADGFDVVAVVLNQGQERPLDPSRATNHEDLTAWLNVPVIPFPKVSSEPDLSWVRAGNQIWDALPC
jgi:dethiobiotin synthetase